MFNGSIFYVLYMHILYFYLGRQLWRSVIFTTCPILLLVLTLYCVIVLQVLLLVIFGYQTLPVHYHFAGYFVDLFPYNKLVYLPAHFQFVEVIFKGTILYQIFFDP